MSLNQPKKRSLSFFERLTGSVAHEEEPVVVPSRQVRGKSINPYRADDTEDQYDTEIYQEETYLEAEVDSEEPEEAQLALDLYETNDALVIKTMTAGVKKDDLQITITRETLTIKGKRENDARSYQHQYHEQELYWGAFSRTVDLPEEIDIEQASATEHHGLVTIKLPKFDKKRKATLKVQ